MILILSRVYSSAVMGIDGYIVEVEVDISNGLPLFDIVGLPDPAVREARERVRSAIKNSGFDFPIKRITLNLAPANVRKEGAGFDLPIAIGILAAMKEINPARLAEVIIVGELSLDGTLRPVKGVLPMAMAARASGRIELLLPIMNRREASIVKGIKAIPIRTLREAVSFLNGEINTDKEAIQEGYRDDENLNENSQYEVDFAEVKGQESAKRALEVAAAGGHNILMVGPPGTGKTMLARRLPTILPSLSWEEALDITKIYSIAGKLPSGAALIKKRPFRAPHHSISIAGLVGGGKYPLPGEISLAHRGVLFLDEIPEFKSEVLELLRQPLEDGCITISRAMTSITYPARFTLIASMNPCPCGFYGDPVKECTCSTLQIRRYQERLSGPLMDRIDIHIQIPRLKDTDLLKVAEGESSSTIRERVEKAQEIQRARFSGKGIYCNAHMGAREIQRYCDVSTESKKLLSLAINSMGLSARAYSRILKVARTIADLAGRANIEPEDIAEAIQYRSLDADEREH